MPSILASDLYFLAFARMVAFLFDVRCGLHAHHHAAGFGLVKDIRGDNLHHNRKAHVGRELRRLSSGLGHALFRDRDAIGIAHQLAFRRRQTGAFVRLDQIEYFADRIIGIRHCLPPGRLFSNWSAARAGHQDRDFPPQVQSRFPMVANAGPALAAASSCGRQSARYGIWYASDDVVKTG